MATELLLDEDDGRCPDCGAMPDEPHTVECAELAERRHARAERDAEYAEDFHDWLRGDR